ncbi:hypothetical protein GGP41_002275 [Bipolaris sorokiniana]|uniref:Uncharacterized protein n=2 Tax=Cochliobolus sativus TaxID=45130 RepID=A0A8H5ZA14_COCSA|nr:uncharacterized protein COCSADRAFT_162316 [Bipolaris sorokiniana ND90Pr]EMD61773.1 hypothetical protein COCSADRAFT_162316 [Bipolaris sorokiniana ND90Pr]KAF5844175.1 hypothetical protein GGP41_002275 [Bipolaris sorokiniana]
MAPRQPMGQGFTGPSLRTINYANSNDPLFLNATLNALPTATDAPFNAFQRKHDPTSLPDTRVDLLRDIYDWANGDDSPSIF